MVEKRSSSFSDLVTCVVINLDSRPDRWKRMRFFCRLRGIDARRFQAHDREKGRTTFPSSTLSPAELGLWSSFRAVVGSEVDTEWLLILEDDALLLPRFRRRAISEIEKASPSVASIRIGWIGRYQLSPENSLVSYLMRLPKRFGEDMLERLSRIGGREGRVTRVKPFGTQAVLIRCSRAEEVLEVMVPNGLPLDLVFIDAERDVPHVFKRSTRSLAWQWPDRSDIRSDLVERFRRENSVAKTM